MSQQVKIVALSKALSMVRDWGMVQVGPDLWEAKDRGGYDIHARLVPMDATKTKIILTQTKCGGC